jgi:hypothetical protein
MQQTGFCFCITHTSGAHPYVLSSIPFTSTLTIEENCRATSGSRPRRWFAKTRQCCLQRTTARYYYSGLSCLCAWKVRPLLLFHSIGWMYSYVYHVQNNSYHVFLYIIVKVEFEDHHVIIFYSFPHVSNSWLLFKKRWFKTHFHIRRYNDYSKHYRLSEAENKQTIK